MAYSDPRTWVTGELVTAALMNAQLRDNLDAVIEGTTGAYVNAVTGPHAIGGSTVDYVRLGLTGAFTSGGASTLAFGVYTSGVLTGHSGDSAAIAGIKANNSIVTAGNCTTIAQLWVSEPQITVGAGSVTNSATVFIESAATEATNDYALWVAAGTTLLDGALAVEGGAVFNDTSGDVDFRIESNDNANMFVVDAGLNSVSFGLGANDYIRYTFAGAFTSGGSSTSLYGFWHASALTGHSGDSSGIIGMRLDTSAVTAGNATLIAQLSVNEPQITTSHTVTNSASVYIQGAATEATNNYALFVDAGDVRLDGDTMTVCSQSPWTFDLYAKSASGAGAQNLAIQTSNAGGTATDRLIFTGDEATSDVNVINARLGVGFTGQPDGMLHVQSASAGSVTAHANADELVVEGSAHTGMTILGGATSNCTLAFGDAGNNSEGQIYYSNHGTTSSLNIQNEFGVIKLLPSGGGVTGVGIGITPTGGDLCLDAAESATPTIRFENDQSTVDGSFDSWTSATNIQLWIGANEYLNSGSLARFNTSYDTASIELQVGLINFRTGDDATSSTRVSVNHFGLTFNGDSAAVNALDDYEEGTFTPVLTGTTSASGVAYDQQNGIYTKIGDLVYIRIYIDLNNKGTIAGSLKITGLPFTLGSFSTPLAVSAQQVQVAADYRVAGPVYDNAAFIYLFRQKQATLTTDVQMDTDDIGNNTIIQFAGSYKI